jgi:hypothetical protein
MKMLEVKETEGWCEDDEFSDRPRTLDLSMTRLWLIVVEYDVKRISDNEIANVKVKS